MTALRGSCLCGGVRFEIDGPLMQSSHYHCRQLRGSCLCGEKGDKLLAGEKAEIGGGDPCARAEWRVMRLLALPAMAMRGSHQRTVNLKTHPAAQAAATQRRHSAASLAWSSNTL